MWDLCSNFCHLWDSDSGRKCLTSSLARCAGPSLQGHRQMQALGSFLAKGKDKLFRKSKGITIK